MQRFFCSLHVDLVVSETDRYTNGLKDNTCEGFFQSWKDFVKIECKIE